MGKTSVALNHGCQRSAASLMGLLLAFCLVGCRSARNSPASPFASVDIHGNTPGQVKVAAIEVFRQHGYTLAQDRKGELVLEKRAGAWDNVAYGDWPGDTPIWIRLKISVTAIPDLAVRLQCRAVRVQDRAGPTEEEVSIGPARHGPYQKLLDEVAKRFQAGAEKR